jgi:Glycosyl transferase family 2
MWLSARGSDNSFAGCQPLAVRSLELRLARRFGDLARFAGSERAALSDLRPQVGLRRALAARVRAYLELDEVAAGLDRVAGRLGDHERALAAHHQSFVEVSRSLEGLTKGLYRAQVHADVPERILGCEAWIAAEPPSDTLISVIMPTHNRKALLELAIASIQEQTHRAWELIVVDDGSIDGTWDLLASIEDARVVALGACACGPSAARNQALGAAKGEVVAYLDDDNRMFPWWLAAIAWAFERHPEHDVLYGARVCESKSDSLPELEFEPFSRELLARVNYMDTNALAHRRGIPGAEWDLEMRAAADWDLALRLTAERPPLGLPVRAALYATSSPDRIGAEPWAQLHYAEAQRRAAAGRPLCVLGVDAGSGRIADELAGFAERGVELAWLGPATGAETIYPGLEQALERHRPDVVLLDGLIATELYLPLLAGAGVPFGVYLSPADLELPMLRSLLEHEDCIGSWMAPAGDPQPSLYDGVRGALDDWRTSRPAGVQDPA